MSRRLAYIKPKCETMRILLRHIIAATVYNAGDDSQDPDDVSNPIKGDLPEGEDGPAAKKGDYDFESDLW